MATRIKDGSKIVFIGDSITDCGRRDPQSEGLGVNGYVRIFSEMMTTREPQKKVEILNRGIGGNTVDDLRARWNEDVLMQNPDYLSVKIGINDLHRVKGDPENNSHLAPEGFKKILAQLLKITKERLPECEILLISPFYLSKDDVVEGSGRADVLRRLPAYIAAVKDTSAEFGTAFIDTQELFMKQLRYQHPDVYCFEPVHPNRAGHMLIAEAVYSSFSTTD
jgi:lysophospholipase L1-like esterase